MMRKYLLFILMLAVSFSNAQEKVKQKARFSIDLKGNLGIPVGDNFMADGLKTFSGYGLGFQAVFVKDFGLGVEFNQMFSSVKDVSVFGALEDPRLTDLSFYLVYLHSFGESGLDVEAKAGIGSLFLRSESIDWGDKFRQYGNQYILGAKVLYTISKPNNVQIFFGPKLYFFTSDINFENKKLEKYYSNATILNLNLGVRFNF
ncbi:hypothetical protein [Epilithonimonas sp. JDS]|uniref:hypothetical protein n=1 Tax=Epilithonimonas sp. JDS TaxID=2902797 RepID=UPI001E32599F|nr:hypothetical protein [Epilithonimonas sp. JDS]